MTGTLPEPTYLVQNICVWVIPFVAYLFGVIIRKVVFPAQSSPALIHQLLLAIPVCLVVVSPLIAGLQHAIGAHVPSYLFTLGIIMEHGMLMQEAATKQLQTLRRKLSVS